MARTSGLADRLKAVPLFAGLSDRELRDVVDHGKVVTHRPGHEVVQEGSSLTVGFHLVLDGEATVLQDGQVRRQLGAGSYFGEISLLDGKPRSATVRAETPLETFSITAWDFQPLLDRHPQMARELLVGLCAQVRSMEDGAKGAR